MAAEQNKALEVAAQALLLRMHGGQSIVFRQGLRTAPREPLQRLRDWRKKFRANAESAEEIEMLRICGFSIKRNFWRYFINREDIRRRIEMMIFPLGLRTPFRFHAEHTPPTLERARASNPVHTALDKISSRDTVAAP